MIVSCMCHENQTKVKGRSWPGKSRDLFTAMTGDRIFYETDKKFAWSVCMPPIVVILCLSCGQKCVVYFGTL